MNSLRTRFNDPTPGVQRSTAETTGKSGRPTLAVRRAGFNPAPFLTLPWASASHDTGSPLARDAVTRVKTGNPTAGYPRDTQISMGLMRLVGSTTPQDSDLVRNRCRGFSALLPAVGRLGRRKLSAGREWPFRHVLSVRCTFSSGSWLHGWWHGTLFNQYELQCDTAAPRAFCRLRATSLALE